MKGFSGFGDKDRMIKVPARFFSDVLPYVEHVGELKVILYLFWRLQRQEERYYIWEHEILSDEVFLQGFDAKPDTARVLIREGLERAVIRGVLLSATVNLTVHGTLYMFNTSRGQAIAQGIEDRTWVPDDGPNNLIDLRLERPTIYTLYEQNIGPLTPLIADQLKDLEKTYSAAWLEDAIRKAVQYGVRNMAYIVGILKKRSQEGEKPPEQKQPRDGTHFFTGKYGDEIEG